MARFGTNEVTTTVVVTFACKEIRFSLLNQYHQEGTRKSPFLQYTVVDVLIFVIILEMIFVSLLNHHPEVSYKPGAVDRVSNDNCSNCILATQIIDKV